VRLVLAAVAAAGILVSAGAAVARADTVPAPVTNPSHPFYVGLLSLGDLAVDSVHHQLIAADPKNGTVSFTPYTSGYPGRATAGLTGVSGLALSADSTTLYAAVPGMQAIVAFSTETQRAYARYDTAGVPATDVVVAGGKLWFTYPGNFGSVDLDSKAVTLHSYTGIPPFTNYTPLIAAVPGAPNLIALGEDGRVAFGNGIAVYDVSTGTDRLVAQKSSIDGVGYLNSIELSPDGSEVIAGGSSGVFRLSSTDLSVLGQYATTIGTAMDVAADGRIAIASRTPLGETDIVTREADGEHAYHLADEITPNGVVWDPDGKRLFLVTGSGNHHYQALYEPVTTRITFTGPHAAWLNEQSVFTGVVSGGVPAGSTLTITRDDAEQQKRPIATATTDANGQFSFTDTPTDRDINIWTATYAGDADHLPSSGWIPEDVQGDWADLTLTRNGSVNAYGTKTTVTAHLGATRNSRIVELWLDPAGNDQPNHLVRKAAVDANGNLSITVPLTRNAVVTATFAGDNWYQPHAEQSVLYTKVNVNTAITKQYRTASGYYYFRKATNPVFTTTMTPGSGRKQRLSFEYYSGGAWHAWKAYTLALTSAGKSTYTLTGTHSVGAKYRVRAAYLPTTSGDTLNYTTYGTYRYFTFTK
jgi:sugar lactone lactonase YvrE